MLKKLRWRFILAAMAAFVTVVATLLCLVNLWNYQLVTRQQDNTLERLAEIDFGSAPGSGRPPFDRMGRFSPEVPYMLRFFSVHFAPGGSIRQTQQQYIASINRSQAEEYAQTVLAGGRQSGYYQGYRFLVQAGEEDTAVVFLNSERELQSMRSLLLLTLVVALSCIVVVFVLVVLFSRRAILPYVRNLEAQKQFITNASHELKTPLTAIATSADVLAMEYPEDEWVPGIQAQAAKLAKLITNLVTLSRVNEENPFPVRAEFPLSEALWETAEPFASLVRAQGKEYSQEIQDGLTLCGDRMAIQQMVSILLDNAMKYTPQGGSIRLTAGRSGKRATIAVSNTCGQDGALDVTRLFDRFYRGDVSHSGTVGGTGIGLSIAKATAEAHGGSIQARQEDGVITFLVKI